MSFESMKSYTGNQVRDKVLFLLACCGGKIERPLLTPLNKNYQYVTNQLKLLRESGYIKISNTKPAEVILTLQGVDFIKSADPDLYEFYMKITNNGHPGGTQRHIEILKRTSGVLSQMYSVGVLIGSQKPKFDDLDNNKTRKLTVDVPTFFLNREMKYNDDQKESRAHVTRSSGALFSRGIRSLVYNSMSTPMRLPPRPELAANMRLIRQTKSIYQDAIAKETEDSIVFCNNDESALNIFNTRTKEKNGIKLIGDAVWDKSVTGTAFRYIPMTDTGRISLNHITKRTKKEILDTFFTEEEQREAIKVGIGEAIIKGLICYEYISCNVTKLAYIKRNHKDLSKIGIVCWEGQREFLLRFFDEPNLRLRSIKSEAINRFLKIEA